MSTNPVIQESFSSDACPLGIVACSRVGSDKMKRRVDLVVACCMLVLLAPVFALVALAVKLTSSGPVFFRQTRLTRNETPFEILKFRTMVVDAEAHTGPTWVRKNDSRITPIGRFLRNSRLDELPQLLNVLRGEMSLIGPRPERPVFVEQFKKQELPHYSLRHTARAGIAGYAQLLNPNPNMEDIHDKTRNDLYYVQHWSHALDLKILGMTVLYILNGFAPIAFHALQTDQRPPLPDRDFKHHPEIPLPTNVQGASPH